MSRILLGSILIRSSKNFKDDFSDPALGRYYEILPGVGVIIRTEAGLVYRLQRGRDGASTDADDLVIDGLGRPNAPTKKAVLRFGGEAWTLEVRLTYDFARETNGRQAFVWLAFGEPEDRSNRSIVMYRTADLGSGSHRLWIEVADGGPPMVLVEEPAPGASYRLRIARTDQRVAVYLAREAGNSVFVGEHHFQPLPAHQSLVISSAAFAGGASFAVNEVSIEGTEAQLPLRRETFERSGSPDSKLDVHPTELYEAVRLGSHIALRFCRITGDVDFGAVAQAVEGNLEFIDCDFDGRVTTGGLRPRFSGNVTFIGCRIPVIGLSANFARLFQAVACEFSKDARFILTEFSRGANFSATHFKTMAFFIGAHSGKSFSFFGATFDSGANLSELRVDGDLTLSDPWVTAGTIDLSHAAVHGVTRIAATLERTDRSLGPQCNFSDTRFGTLSIGAGDPRDPTHNTGPPRWDIPAAIYLRGSTVEQLELHDVNFKNTFDLTAASLNRLNFKDVEFADLKSAWPRERLSGQINYRGSVAGFERQIEPYHSCFISYSNRDEKFMRKLEADLRAHRVKFWYAPKSLPIGEYIERAIRDQIGQYERFLVILSQASLASDWVALEVRCALAVEDASKRSIIMPIRLDEAIMHASTEWATELWRRNTGDMRNWTDERAYRIALQTLLTDLTITAELDDEE